MPPLISRPLKQEHLYRGQIVQRVCTADAVQHPKSRNIYKKKRVTSGGLSKNVAWEVGTLPKHRRNNM